MKDRTCPICHNRFRTNDDYISCPAHSFGEQATDAELEARKSRHVFKSEYDEDGKITRFCARCGLYVTDDVHFRNTNDNLPK